MTLTAFLLIVIIVLLVDGYRELRNQLDALLVPSVEFHAPTVARETTQAPQDYTLLLLDGDGETRHEIHRHTVDPVPNTYSYGERHYTLVDSQDTQHSYKETIHA